MTVSSTVTKLSYSANGSTTVFAYTFKIFSSADLKVYLRTTATGAETLQTLNTHYTVSNVGAAGGGNVTFLTSPTDYTPAATVTVVIIRDTALTQSTDYVENDPFGAESHELALDRVTHQTQELQEELDRAIKLSRTNTMTTTEFTDSAAGRSSKVLSFDSSGELAVTQEIGEFQGNWAASTAYVLRDIVKDTSNNNIYICITAHTSSGAQPISSNTDVAKWSLIVDAAAATTSATAAATSATAAATSATAAAASETAAETAETNAETAETNAETAETNAETAETNAGTSATNAATSATAAATSATASATSATAAATSATNAAASATTATNQATSATNSASTATTQATNAATSATTAATQATNAATSATNAATSATTATTQASNASTSATAAASSASDAVSAVSAVGAKYTFDNSTSMADPGTNGEFRWNNATVGSVTQLSIRAATADTGNPDISPYIITWDDSTSTINGHLIFKKVGTPATFAIFTVTGSVTDNTSWLQVPITHVASGGSWSASDGAYVQFVRNGDLGNTGATGSQGVKGNAPGVLMTFETATTDTDQGAGKVWLNAGNTVLYMDDLEAGGGASINSFVDTWDDSTNSALRGHVYIYKNAAPENFKLFSVTGVVVSASTYSKVPVTAIQSAGTISDTDSCSVLFSRTGDKGIDGSGSMSNFIAAGDSGSNQTIADGNTLQLSGGDGVATVGSSTDTITVSAALKANGGIVVESNVLAVDLAASSITNTLAASDGGTGITDPSTSGNILTSNGSGAWVSSAPAGAGAGYFLGNSSGATGDTTNGLTDIFRVNNPALATSCEIAASTNASATGPLTVNTGITLTVTGTLAII